MRECKEEADKRGYYRCGNGITVDGKRFCPNHSIQLQIDYAGHPFCACLGKEVDEKQVTMDIFFIGGESK